MSRVMVTGTDNSELQRALATKLENTDMNEWSQVLNAMGQLAGPGFDVNALRHIKPRGLKKMSKYRLESNTGSVNPNSGPETRQQRRARERKEAKAAARG